MTVRLGQCPWIAEFPKSRIPSYPKQRGKVTTDVVIVGAGLTGCATAYAFGAAGIKTIVLERDRVVRSSGSASTGWIADNPGVSFADIEDMLGVRAARRAWQAWRRAALDFTALLKRLDVKCQLEPRVSLHIATTPEQAIRLKREHKARLDAGLDSSLVNARSVAREAATPSEGGLRSREGTTVDPYRAALGLAAAAADRGVEIFEKSPVKRITFNRRTVDVYTPDGTLRANRVVIATGQPTELFKSLARHFWFKTTFFACTDRLPAKVRRLLGSGEFVLRDSVLPPHVVRWIDDERLLVAGADGDAVIERQREKTLVQRTGQLMYELSTIYPDISGVQPQYGWDSPYARTADGLPFIGPHRNFPHHLFAFGGAGNSVTGSYLSSRILLRHHQGETDPSDDVFGFRLEKRS